jgi:hypothetical protein
MDRWIRALRLPVALAVVAAITLGATGAASGAVFIYAAGGLPQTIGEGGTTTTTVTVPPGFGPAVDVDVFRLGLTAAADASDQTVGLANPAGLQRLVVNSGCTAYPGGTSFDLDQQAQTSPFGGTGTCPAGTGTYRPSNSPASSTPLTDLLGPSAGSWALTYSDAGAAGAGGTLGSWGLRMTHAPIKLTAKRRKRQAVGKGARIKVRCNLDCTLSIGGDAKRLVVQLQEGIARKLDLAIKAVDLRRTRDGGEVRIALKATGRLREVDQATLRIGVVPQPQPPTSPEACAAGSSARAAC